MIYPTSKLGRFLRHRSEFITIDDTASYKRLRVQLHGKGVVLRDEVPGSDIKTKQQQMVRPGDFLVAEIDAKVGGFGMVPSDLDGAIVSSHYFLFEVDNSVCLPGWLDAYARSGRLEEQVIARGSTNYAAIRPAHVSDFEIPLPPLPEQRRLVTWISNVARRATELNQLRAEIVRKVTALQVSAAAPLFRGLETKPLRGLVSLAGGGTPSKQNPAFWDGQIPWISPKDMKRRRIEDATNHISEEAVSKSAAKIIKPPAVLIVTRGMILAHTVPVAILAVPAAINQDMKALLPRSGTLPEYLCDVLWVFNKRLLSLVEKSTHDTRRLETSRLLDIEIPVSAEQQLIVDRLADARARMTELHVLMSSTAEATVSLVPSLLAQVFGDRKGYPPGTHPAS